MRPSIFVTHKLPDSVRWHLKCRFDVMFHNSEESTPREKLKGALCNFDAILTTLNDHIDESMIMLPYRRVRILANFGAGVEHIDLKAARATALVVTNTPDVSAEATAELAILLMLMAARRAGEGERELRSGAWTGWRPTHLVGVGLTGRTLGLVGFGRIAQATAAKARALGMEIAYFTRSAMPEAVVAPFGARRMTTLINLAKSSDILSIHVPGGPATRHLIDRVVLAAMQRDAILVNAACGSVIDEDALADALSEGMIAAAALDVHAREPQIHPRLLAHPRSVLLPHLGSATIATRSAMGMQAAANLEAFFAGREPPNRVA